MAPAPAILNPKSKTVSRKDAKAQRKPQRRSDSDFAVFLCALASLRETYCIFEFCKSCARILSQCLQIVRFGCTSCTSCNVVVFRPDVTRVILSPHSLFCPPGWPG